ncbi:MAG: hypothetical protein CL927_00065 [Deltaproteobacteria bacterium]|nr:hypothetical protein [Deltaproteobacteria bacterium]HCH66502.1 hypothetical protein [Deltaproteobacteria bacterium]
MTASTPNPMSWNHRLALFAGLWVARVLWSSGLGPSDGELMVWVGQEFVAPFPAPFGLIALASPGVALLGDHPGALRLLFNGLAAAPILLVGRHPAAVALAATLPILAVPGGLATCAGPMAALWLAAMALAPKRPGLSGLACGATAAFHPIGLLVVLPAMLRARSRIWLLLTAALTALPFVPGSLWSTSQGLTGELSHIGLGVCTVVLGGPFLVMGTLAGLTGSAAQRLEAASVLVAIGAIVASSAPVATLAGPLALAIRIVAPSPPLSQGPLPAPHRTAWRSVGIAAVTSITLLGIFRFPLVPVEVDPRGRFVDTATLAQTVNAWDLPTVYALSPPDIARLRWHGIRATTPPPVHPLELPHDILLVMPQSADPDLPIHMGWDHDRETVSQVVAYLDGADATDSRPAAAWTVTVWRRPFERRSP